MPKVNLTPNPERKKIFSPPNRLEDLPHSIGVHCQRGKKEESPNQDDFFVLQTSSWLFCGVQASNRLYTSFLELI